MTDLKYYKSFILYRGKGVERMQGVSLSNVYQDTWKKKKKKKSITNAVAKLVQTAGGNRDGSDILQSEKEKDCLRVVFNA